MYEPAQKAELKKEAPMNCRLGEKGGNTRSQISKRKDVQASTWRPGLTKDEDVVNKEKSGRQNYRKTKKGKGGMKERGGKNHLVFYGSLTGSLRNLQFLKIFEGDTGGSVGKRSKEKEGPWGWETLSWERRGKKKRPS